MGMVLHRTNQGVLTVCFMCAPCVMRAPYIMCAPCTMRDMSYSTSYRTAPDIVDTTT